MRIVTVVFCLFFSNIVFADDVNIKMLNKLDKRSMVYDLEIVRINSGDTVYWESTDPGHNVEFISKGGVPEGVEKFKSKVGKDTEYTFSIPGIYAYWCVPHKTMGMIGFVIVDNDLSNLDSIKKIKYLGKSKKIASSLIDQIAQ
tara:strand:+ start:1040 stop:1471 length:432 start_codon:yes stop_codon:yes gene_type:complete